MSKNSTDQNYKPISVGIVISTYNNPEWLKKTLWGYTTQSHSAFELIIADDGSDNRTRELVESFKKDYFPDIKHVWHADEGFRKCKILNEALIVAESEYLIFTDQDCIPRKDFIETHLKYAQKGYFLSGGYSRLPMDLSKSISFDDITSGNAFNLDWLKTHGLKSSFKNTKFTKSSSFASFMNFITPAKASWNGCNSSGWKEDMLAINGFNEAMQYGGLDREFGERLVNFGIRSKQIRYSAICLHLDHARPYKKIDLIKKNKAIRRNVRVNKIVKTPFGIEKIEE
ncbi:MAG: glycosyltransferase family 2 protein [Dysgonomonas sp.]